MTTADDPPGAQERLTPPPPGVPYVPPEPGTAERRKRIIFDEEEPTMPGDGFAGGGQIRQPQPEGRDPYRWDRRSDPAVIPGAGRGKHGGGTGENPVVSLRSTDPQIVRVKRSWLEIVRDVCITIVCLIIIVATSAFVALGVKGVSGLRSGGDPVPEPAVTYPCATPTTDGYGTYCAETPGGG